MDYLVIKMLIFYQMSNYRKPFLNGMVLLENQKKALILFLIMLIHFQLKQTGKEDHNIMILVIYTIVGELES